MSHVEHSTVPVVTIDGPGGAGKGTVASAIAKAKGWHLLDSGALYRIIAVAGLADGIALDDAPALVEMSEGLEIVFAYGQVRVNGANVTDAIRTEEAGNSVAGGGLPPVRDAIFALSKVSGAPAWWLTDVIWAPSCLPTLR